MIKAGGGIFSLRRQRQRPSSSKNCCTHTRRNVSTAGSSRSQAGASGSYTAVSRRRPSVPIISANASRSVWAEGVRYSSKRRLWRSNHSGVSLRQEPVGSYLRQDVEGMTKGLADTFQPIQIANGGQNVG